jgi:Rieske Fe-S protein
MFLKQSTAYTFRMGPFLDDTDGKTAETGLTIEDSHIRVSKAGGNFIDKNETTNAAHDEAGFYVVILDTTDTNTVGELQIAIHMSGALPVFKTFQVVETDIYAAIFADSATLAASVASILEDTATTIPATIATVDTVVDAVKVVTDAISTNGSGLSAVPWNSSWDAEVQSEVADALVAIGLDHLVSASVAGSDITDNSIVAKLVSKESTADWDDFVNTTDSLQALRDRGDASWVTGGGGSASAIADAVWDEATSGHTTSGTFGEQVKTDIDAILVDTAEIGSAGAGLTAVPWNASWDAEVQSEVADALAAYDPPTKAEMDAMWTTAMTESYASDGATMTPAQALYMILCSVSEFAISSTTITGKKVDGSTTAMTWTINDATDPTSRTRAS